MDPGRIEEMVKSLHGGSGDRRGLAIECSSQLAIEHPDYATHAGRLVAEDIAAECEPTFSRAMDTLPLDPYVRHRIRENAQRLDAAIRPERDMRFDIFGIRKKDWSRRRAYRTHRCGPFPASSSPPLAC